MSPANRTRAIAMLIIACVIPAGLIARSYRADADTATMVGFVATYLGDTLWPIMFYFIGRCVFAKANALTLVTATLAITLTLEFGQLWQPPALQWLRQQPIIGFLLGNHFIWSDVVCCLVGIAAAWCADMLFTSCSLRRIAPR